MKRTSGCGRPSWRRSVSTPGLQMSGEYSRPSRRCVGPNRLDFWTISRTNTLGFLDREPISLERAAASCHVAMIGDSYVQASEVPIADKFHVRLEELARRGTPTSGYHDLGVRDLRHRPSQPTGVLRRIRGGICDPPCGSRLRFQRLHEQCAHPGWVEQGSGPGPTPQCLRDTRRGWDHHAATPYPPSQSTRLAVPSRHPRVTDRLTDMSPLANWLDAKKRALSTSDDIDPKLICPGGVAEPALPRLRRAARRVAANDEGRPACSVPAHTGFAARVRGTRWTSRPSRWTSSGNARTATAPRWSFCPHTPSAPEATSDSTA